MFFFRGRRIDRGACFDPDEARELILDSDSDLDDELQGAFDEAMSESSTTAGEESDAEPSPVPLPVPHQREKPERFTGN